MIWVTGLGRCGMSIVGQVLSSMNYKGGNDLTNYKLPSIHKLNLDIYQQIIEKGSVDLNEPCKTEYWKDHTYKSAIINVTKDKRQGPVHFIIDPCFMWHKEILKTWIHARNNLRFLIVKRDINEIIDSYQRTPPDETELFRGNNIKKYEDDFEDCVSTLKEFKIPHHIGIYPKFLIDGRTIFRAVKMLSRFQFCYIEADKMMKEILEG